MNKRNPLFLSLTIVGGSSPLELKAQAEAFWNTEAPFKDKVQAAQDIISFSHEIVMAMPQEKKKRAGVCH